MATALAIYLVALPAALGLGFGILYARLLKIQDLIKQQEEDRLRSRCNSIFSRILRTFDKLFPGSYVRHRISANEMALSFANGRMSGTLKVVVRAKKAPFEHGQLELWKDEQMIASGCESDVQSFCQIMLSRVSIFGDSQKP